MTKGKSKGNQWEREIAKYLTYWLTKQNKEYYFWRSPGSGAVATNSENNPDLHGDIIPLKTESKNICSYFIFECKNGYNSASLDKHLKHNKNDEIKDFWTQANNDASKVDKDPILIFRKKGFKNPWIGINYKTFNFFNKYLKELRFIHLKWNDLDDIYFFEMNKFFEIITPKIFKIIYEDNDRS